MKTKPQHTAIPWKVSDLNGWIEVRDKEFNTLCKIEHYGHNENHIAENKANAKFIVKAVNNHDALVEALKSVMASLESYNQVKNVFNFDSEQWKRAKQAIAKAEGTN